jgi:putative spermidine/putrescine transport system substrate-binding protein
LAATAFSGFPRLGRAQGDPGTLTVASLGGEWEARERKAVFEPFEKATGVRVTVVAYSSPSQVIAQQRTGNIEWDAIQLSEGAMLPLVAKGYFEKIDYDRIAKADIAGIKEVAGLTSSRSDLHPNGVLNVFFTRGIAYNTKSFAHGSHPRTWAEFWDTKKFPGPRSLGAFSGSSAPDLEFALIADGVPKDKVYPIDIDRAFKSLDRIRPDIAKFWTTGAMAPQMLTDGQVSAASAYLNRIGDLTAAGVPVAAEYNEGKLQYDYWCILKGARNYDNAMKMIAFASKAEVQAALSMASFVSPANAAAFKLIPAERARNLATSPDNLSRQFLYNAEWWADHYGEVQRRWTQWALHQ